MKTLLLLALLSFLSPAAHAYEETFDKGYSSWTVTGIRCSTGTAIELTGTLAGFNVGAYRITNQDSADAVWLGYDNAVSTSALTGLGEKLTSGSSGVWSLGRNGDSPGNLVKIWCKADDSAGAAGAILSRATFYYK